MRQGQPFATIIQLAGIDSIHRHAGIFGRECRLIAREHKKLSGRETRAVRESERDPVRKLKSAQVEGVGSRVFKFEEFDFIAVGGAEIGRMIHDLRDGERPEILHRVKARFDQSAPVRAIENPRTEEQSIADRDRRGIKLRGGRHRATPEPRVGAVEREINRTGRIRIGDH